jgi:serine protease
MEPSCAMFNRYLATALALSIVAFLPAGAAAAGTSFAPLTRAISASHVGKQPSADLRRSVRRARAHYRAHRYCASLKTLGGVAERAAKLRRGARIERAARSLQRTVFLKRAAHRGRCGLAPPRFRVSGSDEPAVKRLPALADGHPRVVARLASGHGVTTDFVQDELVVEGSRAAAAKLAARWHGKVLDGSSIRGGGDEVHLIRVDARRAPTGDLAADLIDIDPRARGAFKVSSRAGLGLVAVAADAAAHGLKVAPNLLTEGAGVLDRSTREGTLPPSEPGKPPVTLNAFGSWYTTSLGTGDAWRALAIGGKTANRVKLAVLDGGFSSAGLADLSPASTGADDVRNRMRCTNGRECPWHGTEVASAAAGVIDNGLGGFGSGGQVADVLMFHNDGALFSALGAVYDAVDAGARIINISSGYELDASVSFFSVPYEDATQTAFERGALVVASAGNDGRDVDAVDCFVVCWEEEWVAPCENDPVICVGGLKSDEGKRDELSNYGREACATAQDCDVDIFGPMNVWVAPDPEHPDPHRKNGTSFSSPFVAGVLAMIMAADPSVSPADAKQALLDSAERSADENVSRIVDAVDAVTRVAKLGPRVEISQADPKPLYGGFNTTTLKATVDSVGPCNCTIRWSSDKDGAMGTGASIDHVYGSPGRRTVTVWVKDAGTGATATDQVEIEAVNERPSARITKPAPDAHVYSGQPFKLEGQAYDPNEPGGLSCDALSWSAPGKPAMAGCSPTMTLTGDNLTTWVTLKATDAFGAWTSYTITLHVDKPPAQSPPLVTILNPSDGELLEPNDVVTLQGTATDPDAGAVTGTWSVKVGSTTKVIGQGNTLQWKPSAHVPQGCGNVAATLIFSATDPDGTSSDQVGVKVRYPVC